MSTTCKPRDFMPQIDLADYPEFLAFCAQSGVPVRNALLAPQTLRSVQCPGPWNAKLVRETTLAKPILASADYVIIDGNTRWVSHVKLGSLHVPSYIIGLNIVQALHFIPKFPKAYIYAGGQQPERI